MSSTERLLLEDYPHHLMRKSRQGERVFLNEADYRHCYSQIRQLKQRYDLDLMAWTILPDRIHLLVRPRQKARHISSFVKALSCRATLRQRSLRRISSPWEEGFRASPVEPGQWLLATMCYIERLPAMEQLASSAFHYRHSSYRMRLGKSDRYWLDDPREYLRLGDTIEERARAYRAYIKEALDTDDLDAIHQAIHRNLLTGSPRFVQDAYREFKTAHSLTNR
ncbi:transposase [Alloalcanivorax marinus]|uniref:transposase n=1 Tax=Alloalcanivorax marinus TaxID=1177169 RepID=UPI001933363B|nr:transposase [Alloalcanivorax marinus]MBL7250210.1 transposase [Alloalcanivorax marinus]